MTASRNQLVTIEGKTVQKIEYQGQPVVTLAMIDDLHGKENESGRRQFHRNKHRFTIGVDFFVTDSHEGRAITGSATPNGLTLLTESGYLKLVKTFTDDLAWKVQGQLIECYFHVKQQLPAVQPPSQLALLKQFMAAIEETNQVAETAKAQSVQALAVAQKTINRVENIENIINTREEFCTIAGYCKINHIKMTTGEMAVMGKRCRKVSDQKGIHVREMFDPRWGRVGLYHFDVLNECFVPTM